MAAAGKQSTNGSRPKTVKLDKIRLDGDTQSRKELDEDVVKEYSDLMKDGVEFPPLGVVFDGVDYWLYDGFHRRHAAVKANLKEFRVIAVNGTREDARWFSYSANITHGLKRTQEDKQKAVVAALKHPKGAKLSDSKIAEHVGVSVATVGKYRKQLESSFQIEKIETREVTRGGTTYEQTTATIGHAPKPRESTKPQASVTGTSANSSADSSPDLPSVGTVNRTDTGSQGAGDAGECPPGEHVWTDDGDGEYCHVCKVSRVDVEPPTVAGKISGGITFDPKEMTPASVKDGHGDEVTGELRHVFEICAEFKEKRQQLTNLKTWITQRVSHPGCAVLASGESRLKSDIDNIDRELKFATPFCECVYCKNKMPKLANCTACKGRGWITQDIYKTAPKEMKRA